MLMTATDQRRDQPLFLSRPVCCHNAPLKLARTVSALRMLAIRVMPVSQSFDHPLFLSVPLCSYSAPLLNRTKVVLVCASEALTCLTPVSQSLNHPVLLSLPT